MVSHKRACDHTMCPRVVTEHPDTVKLRTLREQVYTLRMELEPIRIEVAKLREALETERLEVRLMSEGHPVFSELRLALDVERERTKDLTNQLRRVLQYVWDQYPQLHFCPDWDGLLIHTGSPEIEACTCGR